MKVILAFEDPELTGYEKNLVMLRLLYQEIPEDYKEAIFQALKYLNGGKNDEEKEKEMPIRLYSFEKDAQLIFSAFRQTHGIDLATEHMHWWKFLALFMDLGADTAFCNLVNLRRRVKTGKATKEEIIASREMGDSFDIPDFRSEEDIEKEREFFNLAGIGAQ